MTIPEYLALSKAQARKIVDREYCMHKVAWLTAAARATKKNGRMVYEKFEKFFDKERALGELEDRPQMSATARKIVEYRKGVKK